MCNGSGGGWGFWHSSDSLLFFSPPKEKAKEDRGLALREKPSTLSVLRTSSLTLERPAAPEIGGDRKSTDTLFQHS